MEDGLSLMRMYNLFVQERAANAGQHKDDQGESEDLYREPVSLNAYRQVFNNGFNLEFH